MGWSKSAGGRAVVAVGVAFALAACSGATDGAGTGGSAGASTTGGASGASGAGSGSHAGGTAAGQSAGGAAGAAVSGSSAGGAAGAPTNVYVDGLRGREGCLPRMLSVAQAAGGGFEAGQVRCYLIQAVVPAPGAACACDASQHLAPTAAGVDKAVRQHAQLDQACGSASGVNCASLCLCDLQQATGAALTQCQTDVTPTAELPPGFCYIDATLTPPLGNPALVSTCPADFRRELRITGPVPERAPTLFLACAGSSL